MPSTSTIFSDNQAACSITHHPEFHDRTKHIDIAFHFLCDLIQTEVIDVVYVNTKNNLADIFTKGLAKQAHEDFTYKISVLAE